MSYTQTNHKKTSPSFGADPVINVAEAPEKRLNARKMIANGTDPAAARRSDKHKRTITNANTFEVIAREWHAHMKSSWKESTSKNVLQRLENDIFPAIGNFPIAKIKAPEMLTALQRIERRSAPVMARCCAQFSGRSSGMPLQPDGLNTIHPYLRSALKPRNKGHHPAIRRKNCPNF